MESLLPLGFVVLGVLVVFMTLMCVLPAGYVLTSYLLRKQQDDLVWKFRSQVQHQEDRHYREKADLRQQYEADRKDLEKKHTSQRKCDKDVHDTELAYMKAVCEDELARYRLASILRSV